MSDCECVKNHNPNVLHDDIHHIWPKSEGGPDHIDNLIPLCPTAHDEVHRLLRAYEKHNGTPPWSIRRHYNKHIREVAALGWHRITVANEQR
jgi:5-methylcytosine-specific restriction endonuclease McrA